MTTILAPWQVCTFCYSQFSGRQLLKVVPAWISSINNQLSNRQRCRIVNFLVSEILGKLCLGKNLTMAQVVMTYRSQKVSTLHSLDSVPADQTRTNPPSSDGLQDHWRNPSGLEWPDLRSRCPRPSHRMLHRVHNLDLLGGE